MRPYPIFWLSCCAPFGFLAPPKDFLNYLVFLSFEIERENVLPETRHVH
jgi:hypothetical protein